MGCDIHIYKEQLLHGNWCSADVWQDVYGEGLQVTYNKRDYSGRNYHLFGFLAQVRRDDPNGFEPRGVPDDVSAVVAKEIEQWGNDGHSHSYLLLSELKAARELLSLQKIEVRGMMKVEQWEAFQESLASPEPNYDLLYPYCQATNGQGYTQFSVDLPADYMIGSCLDTIIKSFDVDPAERKAMFGSEPDDYRIVFFFDN